MEEQRPKLEELTAKEQQNLLHKKSQNIRKCAKCKSSMKGHPRGQCPTRKQ